MPTDRFRNERLTLRGQLEAAPFAASALAAAAFCAACQLARETAALAVR